MTKELHPGLGSGALRGALEQCKESLDAIWAAIGDALLSGRGLNSTYANSVAREARTASDAARAALSPSNEAPSEGAMLEAANILTNCCQILDVVKGEWAESWSDWDQSVRDGASEWLEEFYMRQLTPRSTSEALESGADLLTAEDVESSILFACGTFIDYGITAASLNRKIRERLAALSLSRPIEPEAQYDALTLMQAVRRRVEKYQWDSGDANQEATSIANDIIGVVKRALTPSRQGAAKRVEG